MAGNALVAAINWNGRDFILQMIDSLLPQLEETGSCLLVFDNGSTDGSADLVESRYAGNNLVEVQRNSENIGFGRAANRIIGNSGKPVVVLVNTDTVIRPGCLRTLLSCMEKHPEVAFAGPRLLWPDGSLQPSKRDFPFPCKLVQENLPILRRSTAKYSSHDESGYTDWLIGAMMAVRSEPFIRTGGFSEDFFFFHEETDLQYRLREHGWKVWFESSAEIVHIEGGSCRQMFGDLAWLQHIPGKLIFLQKNGNSIDVILYRLFMSMLQLQRMITGLLPGHRDLRWNRNYCMEALVLLWKRKTG